MKMKVYEYTIRDSKVGIYVGYYTLKDGCKKEKELQKQLHSHLVDTFIY